MESPFGKPSDQLLFGELDGQPLVFLPRHGRGHRIPPTELNFRANIDALKRAGVTEILSVSAVGSLKEELPPGTFVICDQFNRPDGQPGEELLRDRPGRSCRPGPPGLRPAGRRGGGGGRGGRDRGGARRHLPGHGGAAVLDLRREHALPAVGLRRDRHDQHAGGQARPGGGALLRHGRHGDRLRLLAPGPRPRLGRGGGQGAAGQCGQGAGAGQGGGAEAGRPHRPLRPRLPPGTGPRPSSPTPTPATRRSRRSWTRWRDGCCRSG